MVRQFYALTKYPDRYIQWPLLAFCCQVYQRRMPTIGPTYSFEGDSGLSLYPQKVRMKGKDNPRR